MLLDDNNMSKCKPIRTPMNSGTEARENGENALDEKGASTYRDIVGSLLCFATKTRPDLCVAASSLESHVERPCDNHMFAATRVLQFLKGALERWMKLKPVNENQLRAYVDLR